MFDFLNRTRCSSSLVLCYTLLRFGKQVDVALVVAMKKYEVMQLKFPYLIFKQDQV